MIRRRICTHLSGAIVLNLRRYQTADLEGVLALCTSEGWPSFPEDPARADRVLQAPGVTTVVAIEDDSVVGFAQLLSDGEIQAYLALIAVHPSRRQKGIGRDLIAAALSTAGGLRVDLLADTAPNFYASLPHLRFDGFRLYPNHSGPDRYREDGFWKDGRWVEGAN